MPPHFPYSNDAPRNPGGYEFFQDTQGEDQYAQGPVDNLNQEFDSPEEQPRRPDQPESYQPTEEGQDYEQPDEEHTRVDHEETEGTEEDREAEKRGAGHKHTELSSPQEGEEPVPIGIAETQQSDTTRIEPEPTGEPDETRIDESIIQELSSGRGKSLAEFILAAAEEVQGEEISPPEAEVDTSDNEPEATSTQPDTPVAATNGGDKVETGEAQSVDLRTNIQDAINEAIGSIGREPESSTLKRWRELL